MTSQASTFAEREITHVRHRLVPICDDNIALLQPGFFGGGVVRDLRHQDALCQFHVEGFGQFRCQLPQIAKVDMKGRLEDQAGKKSETLSPVSIPAR